MTEWTKPVQSWLDTATKSIRFAPDRRAVRTELENHLEDKVEDLGRIFSDLTMEDAQNRAIGEMGDAAELGRKLAKLHRPWWGWLWTASKVLAVLSFLWLASFGVLLGEDAYLGDNPNVEWWDFDGLPRTANMGDEDDICYLPGDNPNQLLALEPELTKRVGGQNISLLRMALWQEEGGQLKLYCYLRLDTWRFWERGLLKENWMTVTDSEGNTYGLGVASPEDPESGGLLNGLSNAAGYGPFHRGYELYLGDLAPDAEWVRLDYGPGKIRFSFTVELKGGSV
ncbi:MAG: permease prefix domain 1-containing protein [Lawsonibacter sp.]|jgi:hypothetical protein